MALNFFNDERYCLAVSNLFSTQSLDKRNVWNETFIVFFVAELIKKFGHIFLWNFITQKVQKSVQFRQHHGAIFIFVIQSAQLNEVMVVSSMFGFLDSLFDEADNLIVLAEFLSKVISLAVFDGDFFGQIHSKCIENVHEIVHVQLAFTIPIVDGADLFNSISIDRHVGFVETIGVNITQKIYYFSTSLVRLLSRVVDAPC